VDKVIEKKFWSKRKILTYAVIGFFLVAVTYLLIFNTSTSSITTDKNKLSIATVEVGVFQEYIPQAGTIQPKFTFYLDAIEGGAIKKVFKESGAILEKGDIILELSNLNRELSVLGQEATLNESINRVRQTRLSLEQNDLQQLQTLAEITNQLDKLKPQYLRNQKLYSKKLISKQEFEQIEADYNYNLKRRDITYRSYKKDSLSRRRQLIQLNESENSMSQSLQGVRRILDNLIIKSPINGQLSTPNLFEGQSITPGERLGQVDEVGTFKVKARIDELYLPQINEGLKATSTISGQTYNLEIKYIYPTITEGRFEVDLEFVDTIPEGIKRGQSIRLRIELGDSTTETLLKAGAFAKTTGGNWAFVLSDDETQAVRKNIQLGRSNSAVYEVISGLSQGDKVITSSYENFGENEIVKLK
jgi:HlyD family secretion protein